MYKWEKRKEIRGGGHTSGRRNQEDTKHLLVHTTGVVFISPPPFRAPCTKARVSQSPAFIGDNLLKALKKKHDKEVYIFIILPGNNTFFPFATVNSSPLGTEVALLKFSGHDLT